MLRIRSQWYYPKVLMGFRQGELLLKPALVVATGGTRVSMGLGVRLPIGVGDSTEVSSLWKMTGFSTDKASHENEISLSVE